MQLAKNKHNDITFYGILIAVFAFLAPVESLLQSSIGSLLKIYTIACIGVFIISIFKQKRIRFFPKFHILLFLIFIFLIISVVISPQLNRAIDTLMSIGLQILLIFMAGQVDYSETDKKAIIYSYVLGSVVLAVLVFTNIDMLDAGRVTATMEDGSVDPNNVAGLIVIGVAALLNIKIKNKLAKIISIILNMMLIIAILMTGSRGACVAILAFFVYCVFTQENIKNALLKILLIAVSVFAILIIMDLIFKNNTPLDLVLKRFENDDTGSGRTEIWKLALKAIMENPILGYGLGNSPYIIKDLIGYSIGSHNTFLTLWLEMGFGAVVSWSATYIYLWTKRTSKYNLNAVVYGMLAVSMIISFFIDAYNKKILWLPILLCMIIMTGKNKSQNLNNVNSIKDNDI